VNDDPQRQGHRFRRLPMPADLGHSDGKHSGEKIT
jgi:hypothetical protein